VCSFCSQLFARQQDSYRPSWEAKEAEKTRVREEQDAKQRKAFWDPLTTTENERAEELKLLQERLSRGPEVAAGADDVILEATSVPERASSRKSMRSAK
jgi:hypothetical protein